MYMSDVSDKEWEIIKDFFKKRDNRGATPTHDRRGVVNGIFYVIKTGCQWRMMPKEFAPWETIYSCYQDWNSNGVWEEVLYEINKLHRKKVDKNETPSYAIIDSQSTKTTLASEQCGYDGGKKVKGRKRHIVVDTLGNLLAVVVHAANIHDTKSAHMVLSKAYDKYSTIKAFSGDAGYRKTALNFVEEELNLRMDISTRIKDTFAILPIRWIVERTFAWINNFRRLAKDYERYASTEENMLRIAMLRLTLKKCV